jgi:hypothetical protein
MTLCSESLIRFELLGGKLKLRLAAHCCAGTLHLPAVACHMPCPVLQNKSVETAYAWACSAEGASGMMCIAAQDAEHTVVERLTSTVHVCNWAQPSGQQCCQIRKHGNLARRGPYRNSVQIPRATKKTPN